MNFRDDIFQLTYSYNFFYFWKIVGRKDVLAVSGKNIKLLFSGSGFQMFQMKNSKWKLGGWRYGCLCLVVRIIYGLLWRKATSEMLTLANQYIFLALSPVGAVYFSRIPLCLQPILLHRNLEYFVQIKSGKSCFFPNFNCFSRRSWKLWTTDYRINLLEGDNNELCLRTKTIHWCRL